MTISISANPAVVTAKSTVLTATVVGNPQPANPIYTWAVVAGPASSAPTFNDNGTATASTTTVLFNRAGGYLLQLTITDGGPTFGVAYIVVNVVQTLTLLAMSPGSITVALPNGQTFIASTLDQFLHSMFTQPQPTDFTWSVQGNGTINVLGGYKPSGVAGVDTIVAALSGKTKTSKATVSTGNYPTVATGAAATPSTVTGQTTALTVLGASSPSGESTLTYTWAVPSSVTLTDNGTNGAKSTTAIFTAAGTYTFTVTIADRNNLTAVSSVSVTVSQTLTAIVVSPANVNMQVSTTQQFSAVAYDQFGASMSSQPTFTWTVPVGSGSVDSTGLYTAGGSPGSATVKAASGSVNGTAAVTVQSAANPPGITFDSGTGTVSIVANDFSNNIRTDPYQPSMGPALLLVTLTSTNSSNQTTFTQSAQYPLSSVNQINYDGTAGGSTTFVNSSNIPCTARGGSGTNLLQGGGGNDTLYGGMGTNATNNTLKGMGGDDTLVGGTGTNYMYGGPGNNTLIPGPPGSTNYLFPNG